MLEFPPAKRQAQFELHLISSALPPLAPSLTLAGHSGVAAVFLETNSVIKVKACNDVMDPIVRQKVLHSLGFRLLDFPYVQPALSTEQSKTHDLVLGVHHAFLTATHNDGIKSLHDGSSNFDSRIVMDFMTEFFKTAQGPECLESDIDYLHMVGFLERNPQLRVVAPGTT